MIKKIENWDWLRVVAVIIPYLIIVMVFQLIAYYIAGISLDNSQGVKLTHQNTLVTFFSLIGTVLLLFVFMKWIDKELFINIGLRLKGRLSDILYGILIGVFVMSIGYLLLLTLDQIFFKEIVIDWKKLIFVSLTFIFVSFSEELLFRGYVLKNFMKSFNKYFALLWSSILFSFMHWINPHMSLIAFIDLFLACILLGLSYIYTKNLWFPIGLHFSWNLFQSLFGFNISGQNEYSIIEFTKTENNYLNGGEFGFEGSVFALVFQIILILILFFYFESKNFNTITPS